MAKDSVLDLNVGIGAMKKPGERVEQGEDLCVLYARSKGKAEEHAERVRLAWRIS